MKALDAIAGVLVIVGGLCWGLVGVFRFDLLASVFGGQQAILTRLVYTLVGVGALYDLAFFPGIRRRWGVTHGVEKAAVRSM